MTTYDQTVDAEVAIEVLNRGQGLINERLYALADPESGEAEALRRHRRHLGEITRAITVGDARVRAIIELWGPLVSDEGRFWEHMERPEIPVPQELETLIGMVMEELAPREIWLFGSRARGTAGPDSDWDVIAVIPDDAPERMTDPIVRWEIVRRAGVSATLLVTTRQDLTSVWGLPNTIGYDLAREGVRLRTR